MNIIVFYINIFIKNDINCVGLEKIKDLVKSSFKYLNFASLSPIEIPLINSLTQAVADETDNITDALVMEIVEVSFVKFILTFTLHSLTNILMKANFIKITLFYGK